MEIHQRIAMILQESNLKQRELADMVGMTESYISALVNKRSKNPSQAFANLVEAHLGYSAQWVLTGEEPKFASQSAAPGLSDAHRKVIGLVEKLPAEHLTAVEAFLDSLDRIANSYKTSQKD